jgi:hypothetical protein
MPRHRVLAMLRIFDIEMADQWKDNVVVFVCEGLNSSGVPSRSSERAPIIMSDMNLFLLVRNFYDNVKAVAKTCFRVRGVRI